MKNVWNVTKKISKSNSLLSTEQIQLLFLAVPFSVVPLKPHKVILTVCCSWRYLRKFGILTHCVSLEIMASNSPPPPKYQENYENRKKITSDKIWEEEGGRKRHVTYGQKFQHKWNRLIKKTVEVDNPTSKAPFTKGFQCIHIQEHHKT
jgi:hypothetical protein